MMFNSATLAKLVKKKKVNYAQAVHRNAQLSQQELRFENVRRLLLRSGYSQHRIAEIQAELMAMGSWERMLWLYEIETSLVSCAGRGPSQGHRPKEQAFAKKKT